MQCIIARVIEEAGAEAPTKEIYEKIASECTTKGLNTPSNNHVWAKLMDERSEAGSLPAGDPEILIGRVWAELPVISHETPERLERPELLLAVALPDRTIISHKSDLRLKRPPVLEDMDLFDHRSRKLCASPRDVRRPSVYRRNCDIDLDNSANARLARILGRSIGNLGLSFRLPRTSAVRLLKNRLDHPLSSDDGELAITFAIRRHNEHIKDMAA